MAAVWPAPRPAPDDLPPCEYPGCGEPAPYGYGCTLRSYGHHFCERHRPDQQPVSAKAEQAEPIAGDLFAAERRRRRERAAR